MDDRAFHLTRDGIEQLKRSGGLCRLDGLGEAITELVNQTARSADIYAVTGYLQALETIVDQALAAPFPSKR